MRYELMRLLQLAFSLALMFGAFLGGLTLGWYRWGRRPGEAERPPLVPASHTELFTPDPDFPASPGDDTDGSPAAALTWADLDLRDAARPHATFAPGALPTGNGPAARTQEESSR